MKVLTQTTVLLSFALLVGCVNSTKLSNQDFSDLYALNPTSLHPFAKIYHLNDTVSELILGLRQDQLLFVKSFGDSIPKAEINFSYQIFPSMNQDLVLDSASKTLLISQDSDNLIAHANLPFKSTIGDSRIMVVRVKDLNRKNTEQLILHLNKGDENNPSNYALSYKSDRSPIFDQYLSRFDYVSIRYPRPASLLTVKRLQNDFLPALPPFSLQAQKPLLPRYDTLMRLPIEPDGSYTFPVNNSGLYVIQSDTSKPLGASLQCFYEGYPKISEPAELLKPLRYLTSNEEFQKLISDSVPKKALDAYWLQKGGSNERARELIRKYYERVQHANLLFTSYLEGWKTDRGMIYIIFGEPTSVYKDENSEIWTYGMNNNYSPVSFTFVHLKNPFSDKDFELERKPEYKALWYTAVEAWREGRVY